MKKRGVIYTRVSTEMQVDGFSLDGQKTVVQRYCDREGIAVVSIYEDAGKSGKSIEGRPDFKRMLSDIENGLDIDYVLVYKLSRFGRNAADILSSLAKIQSYNVDLLCVDDGIDSSKTSGKLLISVLSAVAEIERENILEQTMNGRKEKAKQGKWNGGQAPYGYKIVDGKLEVVEDEKEIVKLIFDKFANTDMGYSSVARYLNNQGIVKRVNKNSKYSTWGSATIKHILDNPTYCGKIAYGRRTHKRVKGTNETKVTYSDDYILVSGEHEAIIDFDMWERVRAKRERTGIRQAPKAGRTRAHLLSGILKCPKCGMPMYCNVNRHNSKKGLYEAYYYVCSNSRYTTGRTCGYTKALRDYVIEGEVIDAIAQLVSNQKFAKEIKNRIGIKIDTHAVDVEISNYEKKLLEVNANKTSLEKQIDTLPLDTKYRERKLVDMTARLDSLYDTIVEIEEQLEDAKLKRQAIESKAMTLDSIYQILINFNKLYPKMTDTEQRNIVQSLVKEIQVFEKGTAPQNLKSITFNFPVPADGGYANQILWENENNVETVVLMSRIKD